VPSLTVFNTLGQQVAVLQNGEQEAGYHEVKFRGERALKWAVLLQDISGRVCADA
jgi:hypothetical protein